MLTLTLILHNLVRWAAIGLGAMAVYRAFAGLSSGRFEEADGKIGRFFAISLDVQMLLGIMMYLFFSRITTSAFENMGSAMSNPVIRFWLVEHSTMMVAALALAHIGVARVRKGTQPKAKHRAGLIFFGIAILVILVGTPWPWSTVARPILPGM
ncbi:MAG: hypothetical protein QF463_13800 [Vicinamibacterales bacterium]|jgi:hypothetical protein|nr:hypothetical protein [Vicinamibacterales bacterium]MDP6610138.1 hypothetical protein [Vicinamibacterales bacterium]HAK56921.1 hypothetical protein [Acidobacteriota bacterium]|tara:strand:+ start:6703 stop:7164 length:462 start_codon:yes stop_codon:yes gene_type:complete